VVPATTSKYPNTVTAVIDLSHIPFRTIYLPPIYSNQEPKEHTELSHYHWRLAKAADATTMVHPNHVHNVQFC